MHSMQRFIEAQQGKDFYPSYKSAYAEIKTGKKQNHWIWYIFPQLATLGYSATAKYFGIVDLHEACEFLKDNELFKNYYEIAHLVLQQLEKIPIATLMGGTVDAQKLTSSLTLFRETAAFLLSQGNKTHDFIKLIECCDQIFIKILNQGYLPCEQTQLFVQSCLQKNNH
ncbi:DUF1810 family protein [Legionella cincinnatiensis]|uniref:Uncharacterized conserved protein n=1 Tax=Legionella cincinnatiensis TaxID=28085 RepID=A0A378IGT3_9GAMM|nr:DUF1810 family protein [Legionella cincinnatiensis]KTC83603.1 hypothetical protein Lcin_2290 [Legionella cincinnatiensis]STX34437.1 Uncharacterized conserved protein [Legionella cincinnatiensis]